MKRDLLILRAMQALMVIQILVGVLSIFTLDIGRAIAVFGSAALIYLGITIIQQLVSIREILSYSATQQPVKKEVAQMNILQQLRRERANKKEPAPQEETVVHSRGSRQPQEDSTENRVYAVRGAPQGE
jgi:uncharacterized protein YacL